MQLSLPLQHSNRDRELKTFKLLGTQEGTSDCWYYERWMGKSFDVKQKDDSYTVAVMDNKTKIAVEIYLEGGLVYTQTLDSPKQITLSFIEHVLKETQAVHIARGQMELLLGAYSQTWQDKYMDVEVMGQIRPLRSGGVKLTVKTLGSEKDKEIFFIANDQKVPTTYAAIYDLVISRMIPLCE